MIGIEEQLAIVDSLIEALDVAQQDLRAMKLYKIEFVDADEVKKKLQELGVIGGTAETPSRITGGPRVTAEGAQAAQPPASRTPGATSSTTTEALVEEPQVVVLASTNSLLINATPEQHTQIAAIIKYVDSETKADVIPYKIYKLENQKPEDLAQVLEKLIQETTKDKEGKIEKVVRRTEEEIVIVPDKNTFCLIVYASKKNQEWIGSLIKTLDQRRPQVLIDVTLVEVSRSDLFDLDLQLASKFPSLEPGGQMDMVGSIYKKPFLSTMSGEVFSSPKTGVGEGFYSDRHIQALLTAMQDKSYGRVLAKPKILVNDGQPGTIKTTDTTNVKLEEFISGGPDKPDRTVPRWEPYTAGITLTITPNISEGELMLLEVELIRSDFGDKPIAGSPPDKRESNIKSTVTVPDGRTIILGGLLKLNQSKGGSKIPILGDIPVAGGLFRSTSNTDRESKLYVFVKANILRPNDVAKGLPDLEKISDVNKMAFQKFEDEFQRYEDWPGIRPRPMNPQRVLEVE
jgi:general secretion pathway protein D